MNIERSLLVPSLSIAILMASPPQLAHAQPALRVAQEAAGQMFDLSIPAQDLNTALLRLADETGTQIVYEHSRLSGLKSSALAGRFTRDEALRRILAGSGFMHRFSSATTVTLEKALDESNNTRVLSPVRVEGAARGSASGGRGNRKSATGLSEDRPRPFSDANVDIPRTIDDVQPYYVFPQEQIEHAGSVNLEDFLKNYVTMNTVGYTQSQQYRENQRGTISTVNLRGLGSDKTLILVNGRRQPAVVNNYSELQPDLNGIPLAAIDRIEVLPSSASGIYGGSAIGGVVNVILKRDYEGGEVRMAYGNTWDADAPERSVSMTYGFSLEEGKTHILATAEWSDAEPLVVADRYRYFKPYLDINMTVPQPGVFAPFALPNINASQSGITQLTLKDGRSLASPYTFIPAGTSPSTSLAELSDLLLANAGRLNTDPAPTWQDNLGLYRAYGAKPENIATRISARRHFRENVEVFAEFSYSKNHSETINTQFGGFFVPAAAPTNPFTTNIAISAPLPDRWLYETDAISRSLSAGAVIEWPYDWTTHLDYTLSRTRNSTLGGQTADGAAVRADILSGKLNPFVDTLAHPLDTAIYRAPTTYGGASRLTDMALRASGPLHELPWGKPQLTLGLERRSAEVPQTVTSLEYPVTTANNSVTTYYGREQDIHSGYAELGLPLVKRGLLPMLHSLELQIAGRTERFTVDAGTTQESRYPNRNPPQVSYSGPTLNGQPYFTQSSYKSSSYTIGFKYAPFEGLVVRASQATAFLPPVPTQLIRNPLPDASPTTLLDPVTGLGYSVQTISGGNPDLKPQNSKSFNAGVIWQPSWSVLEGLRLNAEYYRIRQFDVISSLDAQEIVNDAAAYSGRITRDASGGITLVDTSSLNLYERETTGLDFNLDYALGTSLGTARVRAAHSVILSLDQQNSFTAPVVELAGYHPGEGAYGTKHKGNATFSWERGGFMGGWTARYFGPYKAYGASGGPSSVSCGPCAARSIQQQGGTERIPSQTYHDLFLSYSFDESMALLDGTTLQFSVENVFKKIPPYDAYSFYNHLFSPFGDMRLRTYRIGLNRQF